MKTRVSEKETAIKSSLRIPSLPVAAAILAAAAAEAAGRFQFFSVNPYPGGSSLPLVSTTNYGRDQTRANNAIIPLQAAGTTHFIIDVNGYFE